jgi:hypothetical protein
MSQMKSSTAEERKPQMNKRVRVTLAALIVLAGAVAILAIYMVGITDSSAAESKGYRILAGSSVALIGSCVLACSMDPNAWGQYSEMMRMGGALNEVGPG